VIGSVGSVVGVDEDEGAAAGAGAEVLLIC
jgi:predicted S18 family serine protease